MKEFTITRQQLYELVWSKPLSKLAKEYEISDNGLRKKCIKLNIPLLMYEEFADSNPLSEILELIKNKKQLY